MPSERQVLLDWLYRQDFPSGDIEFDTLLIDAAERCFDKSRIEAEVYAEKSARRQWNNLVRQVADDDVRGLHPHFRVLSKDARRFLWVAKDFGSHTSSASRSKQALMQARPAILRRIDTLTNRQYEAAGCVASRLIGAKHVSVTRAGNEGGVDFFASISVHGQSHIFSGNHSALRVIGQCKKYARPLETGELRSFLTTVNDVKSNLITVRDHIPDWFRSAKGPIVGWVVAHSGFDGGTTDRAKNEGVLLSDSLDLADMLSVSRALAPSLSPNERAIEFQRLVEETLAP